MLTTCAITQMPGHKLVRLDLLLPTMPTKALIASLSQACDSTEDAGPETVLLLRLRQHSEGVHAINDGLSGVDVNLVSNWERTLRRLERLEAPTLAVVDGPLGPEGLALALCCDLRVGTPNASLSLSAERVGILPDMTLYRLVNQLGGGPARRYALWGQLMPAADALRLGVLDAIEAEAEAAALAQVAALTPAQFVNLPMRRRLLLDAPAQGYEACLGGHLAACDRHLRILRAVAAAEASAP